MARGGRRRYPAKPKFQVVVELLRGSRRRYAKLRIARSTSVRTLP